MKHFDFALNCVVGFACTGIMFYFWHDAGQPYTAKAISWMALSIVNGMLYPFAIGALELWANRHDTLDEYWTKNPSGIDKRQGLYVLIAFVLAIPLAVIYFRKRPKKTEKAKYGRKKRGQ